MTRPIVLVWPPASLSGHNEGGWYDKHLLVKKHRAWGHAAARDVWRFWPVIPAAGDIPLHITFYPPNRRGDRTNYANRIKPGLDGIAEAMKVNDRRFLPSYKYAETDKARPRVEVIIGGPQP